MRYEMKKSGEDEIAIVSEELIGSIRPLIEQAKARVAQSVNSELVRALLADREDDTRGDLCKKDYGPGERHRRISSARG